MGHYPTIVPFARRARDIERPRNREGRSSLYNMSVADESREPVAMETSNPVVALVGRPNVGKSTLVNRIVGGRAAVTEEMPGVTRDRRRFDAEWNGRRFAVMDTGGWRPAGKGERGHLESDIREQAEAAIAEAELVILVVDAQGAITTEDAAVAALLRPVRGRVLVAANKSDNEETAVGAGVFHGLGLGEPFPVSAIHGAGVADLLDEAVSRMGEAAPPTERRREEPPQVAIIGRPNVGKSTLFNRLVGSPRVLVSPVPGTTRDPIDVTVEMDGSPYRLIDTAGMRRRPKIAEDVEFFSVLRARETLRRADAALLLIDAREGVTQQDQRIAREAASSGAGLVVVLNKWDGIDAEQRERTTGEVGKRLAFAGWAPVIRISALTGARMKRLAPALETVLESRTRRIPTALLNRLTADWTAAHPPPVRKGRRPRIMYAVQSQTGPPAFVFFVRGGSVDDTYLRFLEGRLRGACDFTGSPLRLAVRRGSGPRRNGPG